MLWNKMKYCYKTIKILWTRKGRVYVFYPHAIPPSKKQGGPRGRGQHPLVQTLSSDAPWPGAVVGGSSLCTAFWMGVWQDVQSSWPPLVPSLHFRTDDSFHHLFILQVHKLLKITRISPKPSKNIGCSPMALVSGEDGEDTLYAE